MSQRIFFLSLGVYSALPYKMRRCLLEGVSASDSIHRILRRGCKAVGPGALVNTSIDAILVASLATPNVW